MVCAAQNLRDSVRDAARDRVALAAAPNASALYAVAALGSLVIVVAVAPVGEQRVAVRVGASVHVAQLDAAVLDVTATARAVAVHVVALAHVVAGHVAVTVHAAAARAVAFAHVVVVVHVAAIVLNASDLAHDLVAGDLVTGC